MRSATQTSAHVENHTTHKEEGKTTTPMGRRPKAAAPIGMVVGASAASAPLFFMCGVWLVVLLCGARVLDDVRREAQAGQRTCKARSQVLPCKPRHWAYACWLRRGLQKKSTFPKKDLIFQIVAIISQNHLRNEVEKLFLL